MGHTYGLVFLTHDGSPCLISGDVTLRFFDDRGALRLSATSAVPYERSEPGWAMVGRAQIAWDGDWCDADHPIVAVEVTYDRATYRAALSPWTRSWGCDPAGVGASRPGSAGVRPIAPETTPTPRLVPPPMLDTALSAPARARAGDTLKFVVTLTNSNTDAMRFDPCPNYAISLDLQIPAGDPRAPKPGLPAVLGVADARHALNCAALPALGTGESVELAMQLDVPTTASGPLILRWLADNARVSTALVIVDGR